MSTETADTQTPQLFKKGRLQPPQRTMSNGVHEIYLEVRPQDIAYIKFIIESYEVLGIIRTVDSRKAVIVVLVVPDAIELAERVLEEISTEVPLQQILRPDDIGDDWLLNELKVEE